MHKTSYITIVHVGPMADARLQQMGLSTPLLNEVLLQAYNARAMQTSNAPPAAPGFSCWAENVKALRDRLCPQGWSKDDRYNISRTIEPTQAFGIIVCTGDAATGQAHQTPTPKRPRGEASTNLLKSQLTLFDQTENDSEPDQSPPLWIFLFRIDGTTIHAELSLPAVITDQGVITAWQERILLPSFSPGSGPSTRTTPMPAPEPTTQPPVTVLKKKTS